MTKFFLTILIFICSVSGIYSAYLLFKDGIEPIVGAILISACIVVFIWCLSLLKRHRLGGGTVFWVFAITILLLGTATAYASIEPMEGWKDKVENWLGEIPKDPKSPTEPKPISREYFLGGTQHFPKMILLDVIDQWSEASSNKRTFKSTNPPYVINADYIKKTSQITTKLTINIYRIDDSYKARLIPIYAPRFRQGVSETLLGFVIEQSGDYVIDVESVGCEWWVKIGSEPSMPDLPEADAATYMLTIKNTNNTILTNDYELIGSEVGKRVFILHGFWEMRGQDFVYKDGELILDEGIFGIITVRRR